MERKVEHIIRRLDGTSERFSGYDDELSRHRHNESGTREHGA
jgi:hypothetical protein